MNRTILKNLSLSSEESRDLAESCTEKRYY